MSINQALNGVFYFVIPGRAQGADPESMPQIVVMDSGFGPSGPPRNDEGGGRQFAPTQLP
jgi:hypothetical protein